MENRRLQTCEQRSRSKQLGKGNHAEKQPLNKAEPVESLTITESINKQNQNLRENFRPGEIIATFEEAMQKLVHVELVGVDDDECDHSKQNRSSQQNFGPGEKIATFEEAMQKLVHVELEGVDDGECNHYSKQNRSPQQNFGRGEKIATFGEAMEKLVHVELEGVDDGERNHFKHFASKHGLVKHVRIDDDVFRQANLY